MWLCRPTDRQSRLSLFLFIMSLFLFKLFVRMSRHCFQIFRVFPAVQTSAFLFIQTYPSSYPDSLSGYTHDNRTLDTTFPRYGNFFLSNLRIRHPRKFSSWRLSAELEGLQRAAPNHLKDATPSRFYDNYLSHQLKIKQAVLLKDTF